MHKFKLINWILLFLIIIGLGALATYKIWVPKLVNRIVSAEIAPNELVKYHEPSIALPEGRSCYSYAHIGTAEAPYTVHEVLDIRVDGNKVTGQKDGTQSGPDMTNGYTGTINGTVERDTLGVVYAYVVEGSANKEKEIYRINQTGLVKLRYPLTAGDGMLVPDTTKEFKALDYPMVDCAEYGK